MSSTVTMTSPREFLLMSSTVTMTSTREFRLNVPQEHNRSCCFVLRISLSEAAWRAGSWQLTYRMDSGKWWNEEIRSSSRSKTPVSFPSQPRTPTHPRRTHQTRTHVYTQIRRKSCMMHAQVWTTCSWDTTSVWVLRAIMLPGRVRLPINFPSNDRWSCLSYLSCMRNNIQYETRVKWLSLVWSLWIYVSFTRAPPTSLKRDPNT